MSPDHKSNETLNFLVMSSPQTKETLVKVIQLSSVGNVRVCACTYLCVCVVCCVCVLCVVCCVCVCCVLCVVCCVLCVCVCVLNVTCMG